MVHFSQMGFFSLMVIGGTLLLSGCFEMEANFANFGFLVLYGSLLYTGFLKENGSLSNFRLLNLDGALVNTGLLFLLVHFLLAVSFLKMVYVPRLVFFFPLAHFAIQGFSSHMVHSFH